MDCKEIRDKLPDYLAGKCSEKDRDQISRHLSDCSECMEEMIEMEKPILGNDERFRIDEENSRRLAARARKKLVTGISARVISLILAFVLLVFVFIPGIFSGIRMAQFSKYTRAMADIVQFSAATNAGGYGNRVSLLTPYSTTMYIYASDAVGTKQIPQKDFESKLSFVTGRMESPVGLCVSFYHPSAKLGQNYLSSAQNARKVLDKNQANTVATINISLGDFITLEEAAALLQKYDIKVLWLAVECGEEKLQPKNMSGLPQYIQWGIPGTLYRPASQERLELSPVSLDKYEKAVKEELAWLDKNKGIIKPMEDLQRNNGIDTSVGNRAAYVLKNGLKIYGLRLTGPTSELLKLQDALNIRTEDVTNIDFWYWK